MNTLFDIQPAFPQGFEYIPDFISESQERDLITACKEVELHPLIFQGFTALRKVKSYGYDYNFDRRSLAPGLPIPPAFDFLITMVAARTTIPAGEWAELLVTEYPPGSVINWHRDAPPFGVIAGISLLSDAVFRLRPYDKAKQHRKAVISFPVLRRSLYIMKETSREEWEHSISPVNETRFSITLRTLR